MEPEQSTSHQAVPGLDEVEDRQMAIGDEEEVYEDGIITEMVEDEIEMAEIDGEYDSQINNQFDSNVLYNLYQPMECANAMLMCRICHHMGKEVLFQDRAAYTTHRYKVHGSFNNSILCPIVDCKDAFASTIHLRKHLMTVHHIPLEMHHQIFVNMVEFEKWRNLVETASHCRFLMHTKQPHRKRQILHCAKSEHKQVLQSRTRKLPKKRMLKEGACCPAVISYRQDDRTGVVHAFYQLFHVGHTTGDDTEQGEDFFQNRTIALHFVEPPTYMGDRPMQYLQIDFMEMESGLYQSLTYSSVLIITDLTTGFTWAKPMTDPLAKVTLQRIICDLLCQYGVPDGFGTLGGAYQRLVKEVMASMEEVFQVQIREIHNEPPEYDGFRTLLLEQTTEELKNPNRWPEVVPFTTMNFNQSGIKSCPFERFFKRKPHSITPPPYIIQSEKDEDDLEQYNPSIPPITYGLKCKVYLRNADYRNPRSGVYQPYYFGMIGEIDFNNMPHFPYKIHYTKTQDTEVYENSPHVWASPFDILPTNRECLNAPVDETQNLIKSLLCICKEGTSDEPCPLFRSSVCIQQMSKACCKATGKRCGYHEHSSGDDSYTRMEKLTKYFSSECTPEERRHLKGILRIHKRVPSAQLYQPYGEEGKFPEESLADLPGVLYYPGEESPPPKRRRHPVRPGASELVLRTADGQVVEKTRYKRPDQSCRAVQPQVLIVTDPQEQFVEEEEIEEEEVEENKAEEGFEHNESILEEEYEPPISAGDVDQPSQEPVRRSGRPVKAKVYKDFVTE